MYLRFEIHKYKSRALEACDVMRAMCRHQNTERTIAINNNIHQIDHEKLRFDCACHFIYILFHTAATDERVMCHLIKFAIKVEANGENGAPCM